MPVVTMVMVMVMTMAMTMSVPMGVLLTLIQLVFQQIANNGTTKRTQKTMVLLMAEVISRCSASKRTSDSTLTLGVGVGIMFFWMVSAFVWLRVWSLCYVH